MYFELLFKPFLIDMIQPRKFTFKNRFAWTFS